MISYEARSQAFPELSDFAQLFPPAILPFSILLQPPKSLADLMVHFMIDDWCERCVARVGPNGRIMLELPQTDMD